MKKYVLYTVVAVFVIAFLGCASGSNAILDKASVTNANTKINDLKSYISTYKLRYGVLPPESKEKPLFESLAGIMPQTKMADFMPTIEAVEAKNIDEAFSKMYEAIEDPNNPENKIDKRNQVVIEKLKEINKARYDEIYAAAKKRIDDLLKEEQKNKTKDKTTQIKNTEPSYDELYVLLNEEEVDAIKKLLIDKDTMSKIKQTAMSVYKKIQPPFNTDEKKGGWSAPKWIIEKPDVQTLVAEKVAQYKSANNNREPNASILKRFETEAQSYSEASKVGYLIWMANDSKNTLVFAKVR